MKKQTQQSELALEDLRGLYELVQSLNGAQGRDGIVTVFLEKLMDLVPFESCSVMLPGDFGFGITHAAGEHAASLVGRKVASGEGISGWVLANRHPLFNTDPTLDLPISLVERFSGYRTLAVFPLLKGNDLYGAVALYSSSQARYDETQQRLLGEASALFALALSTVMPPAQIRQRLTFTPQITLATPASSYNNPPLYPFPSVVSEHSQ